MSPSSPASSWSRSGTSGMTDFSSPGSVRRLFFFVFLAINISLQREQPLMNHFFIVAIPAFVIHRQVRKQKRLAIVIMIADLPCRQVDVNTPVPLRVPTIYIGSPSAARIQLCQSCNQVITLPIRFVHLFQISHPS